jgi:hypothetical protein
MSSLAPSETSADESAASGVSILKSQVEDLQRKLGRALKSSRGGAAEDDKDGGYVNVEFVRVGSTI